MKLTKASEYGILTMVYLAKQPTGRLCDIGRIADAENIPASFLSKLVTTLVKAGLVRSHRGPHGGIELARPASSITLRHVIEATEGEIAINDCTTAAPHACMRHGCTIQGALRIAQNQFLQALDGFTLASLARTESFFPPLELEMDVVTR